MRYDGARILNKEYQNIEKLNCVKLEKSQYKIYIYIYIKNIFLFYYVL